MPIQIGINRDQLEFNSLESLVDSDSEVRVIDLFLDIVDYNDLGFTNKGSSHEGRPAFAADVFLGIHVRLSQSDPLEQEVGKSLSSQCRTLVGKSEAIVEYPFMKNQKTVRLQLHPIES